CSETTWPPSSWTAISKVDRVLSDAFSNSIATCRPSSALAVGAERPSERSALICAASTRHRSRSPASKSSTDRKSFRVCGIAAASFITRSIQILRFLDPQILRYVRQVLYSALMRTYSALRSHVQTVEEALP